MPVEKILKIVNQSCVYKLYQPNEPPIFTLDDKKKYVLYSDGWYNKAAQKIKVNEFEFLYKESIQSTALPEKGKIQTPLRSYQLLRPLNEAATEIKNTELNIGYKFEDIEITLVWKPFVVGFYATQNGYAERFKFNPYEDVLEIKYPTKTKRKQINEESLINNFLLTLAKEHDIIFVKTFFVKEINSSENVLYKWFKQRKLVEDKGKGIAGGLKNYSDEGLALFISARETQNIELKIIQLYKTIEYFASIYDSCQTYNELNEILKTAPKENRHETILKVRQLSKKITQRSNDKEQVKSIIRECIIFDEIKTTLPPFLKKEKHKGKQMLDKIGESIYSTRNSIVHAKRNYKTTNEECPEDERSEFSQFLEKIIYYLFDWHENLPEEEK